MPSVDVSMIEAARSRIADQVVMTPLLESPVVNELLNCRLLVKAESLQRTGAFKFRGALHKARLLSTEARRRGFITSSSGNHGSALAAVARMLDVKSTIVVPLDAPSAKVEGIKRSNGNIIFYDRKVQDRFAIVDQLIEQNGMTLVPPYDDLDVMCGQGTIGLEIVEQCKAMSVTPDLALIPSSGGGLSGGVTVAMKSKWPSMEVFTVEPTGFDRMARSLARGERVSNEISAGSVQDALIGAPTPGELPFAALTANRVKGVTVRDAQAMTAMSVLFQYYKLVAEPGGAAAVAAALYRKVDLAKKTVVAVCSGGNVDRGIFSEALSMPWSVSAEL